MVAGQAPVGSATVRRPGGHPLTRRSAWVARLDSPLAPYYLILGSVIALVVIGLVMVLSSSNIAALRGSQKDSYAIFAKQAIFAAIGLPLAFVASRIRVSQLKALAWPALGVGMLGLIAVAAFGRTTGGNTNWLYIGPVGIQPSEAAKLALIVWAAAVLARKQAMVGQVAHALIPVVPGALVLLALVMVGNDLGTALVLVAITVALLFTAGVPLRLFAVGGLLGGLAITLLVTTSENRMKRVNTWLGNTPCEYLSTCWQPTHSRYALATGGWWGVGLGAGREKWLWLSQAHNDFIFAVIGEELGLIGTLTVLALFAALGIGLFKLVIASDDTFVKIATGGVLAWVLGQAIINIGTVLGMLPVIGLPLPLVSSGGSALVTVMIAFGMVLGFARQVPGAPEALAARPRIAGRTASVLSRRGTTAPTAVNRRRGRAR